MALPPVVLTGIFCRHVSHISKEWLQLRMHASYPNQLQAIMAEIIRLASFVIANRNSIDESAERSVVTLLCLVDDVQQLSVMRLACAKRGMQVVRFCRALGNSARAEDVARMRIEMGHILNWYEYNGTSFERARIVPKFRAAMSALCAHVDNFARGAHS